MGTFREVKNNMVQFTVLIFGMFSVSLADNCEWIEGMYGDYIQCQPGFVATGACGSGRKADCKGQGDKVTQKIHCCQTANQNDPVFDASPANDYQGCDEERGFEGKKEKCEDNKAVYRMCGSGMNHDCRSEVDLFGLYSIVIDCCTSMDVQVADHDMCVWSYGNYGNEVKCPSGYLMAGYCGSGSKADCPSETFFGVFCCPYTDQ